MPRDQERKQLAVGLPPLLAAVLRAAHYEELAARGTARRAAFRLTRDLLGAAIRSGVPAARIAGYLGVTVDSVRTRASRVDGETTTAVIEQLSGLTPAQLSDLSAIPLHETSTRDGIPIYSVTDLVRTVLAVPPASRTAVPAQ